MTMETGPGKRSKNVFKGHELDICTDAAPVPVGDVPSPAKSQHEEEDPEIQVDRGGDGTIRAITVRCSCGRVTTLECEYSEQGEQNEDLPI